MATPVKQSRKTNRAKNVSPVGSTKKNAPIVPVLVQSTSSASLDLDIVSMETEESRDSPITTDTEKIPIFKDPNFVRSNLGSGSSKRTRNWKNLKQIIAADRALPWKPEDVTYGMIDAPPSFKPAMKYSDLSGLPAKYTDPQTKLRYATTEEYARIRLMPSDLVTGCLALRKANVPV